MHRGICELLKSTCIPPMEPGAGLGAGAGCFESLELASIAQHARDLPAETARLRDLLDLRLPLEHQRPHAGQAQTPPANIRPGSARRPR